MANANDFKKEVEKLVAFLTKKAKDDKVSSFVVRHEDLYKLIENNDRGEEDPKRIQNVLKPELRKKQIVVAQVPDGYRFTLPPDRKVEVQTHSSTRIEIKDVAESAEVETMTDFDTEYIAPRIYNDVRELLSSGLNVLIVGPPGCGKSRIFEQLAKGADVHCIRRQMSAVYDPEMLLGTIQVVKDEQSATPITKFIPGSLTQSVQNGWFFIGDEYDNATAASNESLKMITEKGGKMVVETEHGVQVITRHPKFRMGFTANTWCRGDASGNFPNAQPQNGASLDRIDAMMEMGYDADVEKAVMLKMGIENHVVEYFFGNGKESSDPSKHGLIPQLREVIAKNDIRGDLGMRKIIAFSRIYPLLGWHKALLYAILNKFETDDHQFMRAVIEAKFGKTMFPTNDMNLIRGAEKDLAKLKLKSCP